MCNNWPDFPISVEGATGGLIGNTVIICGGYYVDECYSLTSEKVTLATHMSVGRWRAASIVINDTTLWVTGGSNDGRLASSEYVTMTGTWPGPDLPMALDQHAIVNINSTYSMFIGGFSGSISASTFYWNHNEWEWISGPSLIQARGEHSAGIVTDRLDGFTEKRFVVVAGGSYHGIMLDSTEILQDGNWFQGKMIDTICYVLETA